MAKVLLVEDDNNLREIYEARLQAEGYEIAAAQDGEQALVVAKDFKPDLVISDVMMPKISGFEMLDILRNTEGLEHTRVIMLTALSQAEDKERADSLGADRYLVKSQVTLEDIIKAAHDILGDGSGPAAAPASDVAAAVPQPAAATDLAVAATPPPAEPATPAAVPVTDAPAEPTPVAEPAAEAAAPATAEAAIAEAIEAETPSNPVPAPATEAPVAPETDQIKDDKLLADAATSLDKSTGTAPTEPAEAAPEPTSTPETPVPETTEDSSTGASAGSSKRVIQPIDAGDDAKPTLEELLAREEAKEIAGGSVTPTVSNAPTEPTPDVTPPPAPGSTTAPGKSDDVNPHDISL
jgi:CheY-like chemotaxis protein